MEKISFTASLKAGTTAIQIDGTDSNCLVKLEVPASELAQVLKLAAYYSGKIFKVTVENDGREKNTI